MNIWFEAETQALTQAAAEAATEAAAETLAMAEQVKQDLEQLQPNVILETMKGWIPGLLSLGYRLLIAALILLIGIRIAKTVQKMLGRTFDRMDVEVSLRKFLLSMVYAMICGLAVFAAADKIGISSASIVAVLGSAGIALGLALQESLGNFAGGVLILLMKPFKVGDFIICDGKEGTVSAIGLVYTTLNTIDNKRIVVPNGTLSNSDLTNVTAQDRRRLEIKVGIGYQSDLKKAKDIMVRLFEQHPCMLKEEPVLAFVDELADSAVVIGARGWVSTPDYWQTRCDLLEQVKLTFDEEGIEIPFNQLEVRIKG